MAPRGRDFPDSFVPWVAGEPLPGRRAPGKKPPGRHPYNKLTEVVVRRALPGRHADGNGLYLYVRSALTRQWVQRLVIHGHRCDIGLGAFPLVRLAEVRRLAVENRRIARAGGDPRLEGPRAKGPTFRSVYEDATEMRRKAWDTKTTEASWRRGFEKYVLPVIGDKPVAAVTLADLREIVLPHWNGRNSTGYTLRQNIEYVLQLAVDEKHRLDNPADALKRRLPKVRKVPNHRASLSHTEVREAMAQWQALSINPAVKLAVLFIVLTAARLTEATHATWSEVRRAKRLWRIPARRMKMRRSHDVPLSRQALEVLVKAGELERSDSLIFALRGSNGVARPPSQRTVSDALRQLARVDADGRPIVVHGFRTTFRVWAMECVPASSEAAEIALAHEESDPTKKAYARSLLDEQRAMLMQQWADYVLPDGWGAG